MDNQRMDSMSADKGDDKGTPLAQGWPELDLTQMAKQAGQAAALLKALANENRLLILCNLVGRELSVGELLTKVPLSQSALSQHLALLREEGLVRTRREAQVIYYSLADARVSQVIDLLHRMFCQPSAAD
jgi:DNA-binding transcriptional ArsR family regulator